MKSHNAARKAECWGLTSRVLLGVGLTVLAATVLATTAQAGPVTTGLTVWLDAADPTGTGSTPVPGALATWANKAPSGQQDGVSSVVQATSVAQPTLTTPALGLNGLPVVRFNGSSDFMQSGNAFTTALSQPTEIFMVWKADSIGSSGASIAYDGFSSTGRQTMAYEPNGTAGIDMGAPTPTNSIATPFLTAVYTTALYDSGTALLRIDGTPQTFSSSAIGTDALDGLTVGGRFAPLGGQQYSLDGYIAELLVYSGTETYLESIQGQVESYLHQEWFVPVPEPASATLASIGLIGLTVLTLRRRRPLA